MTYRYRALHNQDFSYHVEDLIDEHGWQLNLHFLLVFCVRMFSLKQSGTVHFLVCSKVIYNDFSVEHLP